MLPVPGSSFLGQFGAGWAPNLILGSGHNNKLKFRFSLWPIFGHVPAKLGLKTLPDGSGSKDGADHT